MRMSMAQEAAEASAAEGAEKMDVDEQKGDEDYSEAMNDPAFLQVTVNRLHFYMSFCNTVMWKKMFTFETELWPFCFEQKKIGGNTYLLSLCFHLT